MKKKFLAALAVVCLLLSGTASAIPFTDVPLVCEHGLGRLCKRDYAGAEPRRGVLGAAPPSVPPAGDRGASCPRAHLFCA